MDKVERAVHALLRATYLPVLKNGWGQTACDLVEKAKKIAAIEDERLFEMVCVLIESNYAPWNCNKLEQGYDWDKRLIEMSSDAQFILDRIDGKPSEENNGE